MCVCVYVRARRRARAAAGRWPARARTWRRTARATAAAWARGACWAAWRAALLQPPHTHCCRLASALATSH